MGEDPHFSIVLQSGKLLCYTVQGKSGFVFNLISNKMLHMNAMFVPDSRREEVSWLGSMGIVVQNISTRHPVPPTWGSRPGARRSVLGTRLHWRPRMLRSWPLMRANWQSQRLPHLKVSIIHQYLSTFKTWVSASPSSSWVSTWICSGTALERTLKTPMELLVSWLVLVIQLWYLITMVCS